MQGILMRGPFAMLLYSATGGLEVNVMIDALRLSGKWLALYTTHVHTKKRRGPTSFRDGNCSLAPRLPFAPDILSPGSVRAQQSERIFRTDSFSHSTNPCRRPRQPFSPHRKERKKMFWKGSDTFAIYTTLTKPGSFLEDIWLRTCF